MAAGERTLILAEGFSADPHYGKTMRGVLRYRRDDVVGILDSTRAGESTDGVRIVGDMESALALGPEVAIVGVATQGGRFPPAWREILRACIGGGLSIENGLHEMLADDPELRPLADAAGVELRDLRRPPAGLDCATGANLEVDARIVLTVGSDCAIGKMTVSLELDRAARERGIASVFVPTGQTGIAIAGWGIAVDAVVADFVSGAAEQLVLEGSRRGGDLLWVEGQGALLHPAYSGVTLGLYHGSVPHALVLCHRVGSTEIEGSPGASNPAARGSRRAPRAHCAATAPGARGRPRAEHRRARRPHGARGRRCGHGGDRVARRRPRPRRRRCASRRGACSDFVIV